MIIEIDYKRANLDFRKALAASLGVAASRIEVLVTPAKSLIPFLLTGAPLPAVRMLSQRLTANYYS